MNSQRLLCLGWLALLWLTASAAQAQKNRTVSGTITGDDGQPLPYASVVLMQPVDSLLYRFGITDDDGGFALKDVGPGDYLFQVSYTGFDTRNEPLTVEADNEDLDLGALTLTTKAQQLEGVEITAEHIPIQLIGDTIQYNPEAFKTQPNADVEDLLKKLPGLQVDREGNIKAQGEEVQKVLVDGKEFFGDDLKVATQNLPADAIDKVQVYDKLSEISEFTGVDDGQRLKTINLKLKEDRKQGYFGNVSGGYGTQNSYQGKANLNRFSKKTQLSAIGMANNTNQQGFSFDEYLNFIGGLQSLMSSGGSVNIGNLGIPLGAGQNRGFNTTWAGGANLGIDLAPGSEVRSSYFYNRMRQITDRETYQQNLSGDSRFDSRETTDQLSKTQGHRVNNRWKQRIDSLSDFTLTSNLSLNTGDIDNDVFRQNFTAEGILQSDAQLDNASSGNNPVVNNRLLYRRRFQKTGRSMYADASLDFQRNENSASLNNQNRFFDATGTNLLLSDTTLQNQSQTIQRVDFGGSAFYTEPLGKGRFVEVGYAFRNRETESEKNFFDRRNQSDPSEVFNEDLSGSYTTTYAYHQPELSLQWSNKKRVIKTGLAYHNSNLTGVGGGPDEGGEVNRNFEYLLPKLSWRVNLKRGSRFYVNYTTAVQEPTVEQMQPVLDNTNPLSTYIGNPNLDPAYNHRFSANLMTYNQFSFTGFNLGLQGTYTQDAITNAITLDSSFAQSSMPVNVDGMLTVAVNSSFNTPLPWPKVTLDISPNFRYARSIVPVNDIDNLSNQYISSVDVSLENRRQEHVQLSVGARLSHNITEYSQSPELDNSFLTQLYYTDLGVDFKKTWHATSSLDLTLYPAGGFTAQRQVAIWTIGFSKDFLKHKRGNIELSITDLLNQNVGITQTGQGNAIVESQTQSLGRYAMVSFRYKFRAMGK